MEHGHSIDETDENENTCLHIASMIGSHPVVQYLIEKGSNVEAKIRDQQIHIACVFYWKSVNIEAFYNIFSSFGFMECSNRCCRMLNLQRSKLKC